MDMGVATRVTIGKRLGTEYDKNIGSDEVRVPTQAQRVMNALMEAENNTTKSDGIPTTSGVGTAKTDSDETQTGEPNMITTPTGGVSMITTLKQVECIVGVGTSKTDNGVATRLDDETPAGKPSMSTTPMGGMGVKAILKQVEKGKQVASVCIGLGTTTTLAKGLAKEVEIINRLNAKKIIGVGTPMRQTAIKKARDIGPEVASLTQGLATKLRLGLDKNEVVVKILPAK